MPDKQDNNIDVVVVVVSGQPERLKVNVHQTLEHLVHKALQKSGNPGQAPSEWELRTEDGRQRPAAPMPVHTGCRDLADARHAPSMALNPLS